MVQQKHLVCFSRGWTATLDKLQVKATSSLRLENNIPIPEKLVIIPNPEIQAIINDKSPVWEVDRVGPATTVGWEETIYVALSSAEEPPRA